MEPVDLNETAELASQLIGIVEDYLMQGDDGLFVFSDDDARLVLKAADTLGVLRGRLNKADMSITELMAENIELEDELAKAEHNYAAAVEQLRELHPCIGCKHCEVSALRLIKKFSAGYGTYLCPHYFELGVDPDQDCYEFGRNKEDG